MRSALSNRVVLMAVIFVVGLSVASALAARSGSLLAPPAGPPAVEPAILVGSSEVVDLPMGMSLNAALEVAEYNGSIPDSISTIRGFMP